MEINYQFSKKILLSLNEKIEHPLIVCSHERSGTHFLMNSIASNFPYNSDLLLDFDLFPLGSIINFYNTSHVTSFLNELTKFESNNIFYGLSSIVKSHHDSSFFIDSFPNRKLRFIYIYRNPVDTLKSFWRFVHRFKGAGKITASPIDFCDSPPEGRMMRYQVKSYQTLFDRWANHVLGWLSASEKYENILIIRYQDLKYQFDKEIQRISDHLEIDVIEANLQRPERKYIKGQDIYLDTSLESQFNEYIKCRLTEYPVLQSLVS